MTNIVVDTNILFSALRKDDSFLRTVLLNNKDKQFFAPNFLFSELFRHKEKLMHKTQASEEQIYEFLEKILQVIHFVNDELIATENLIEAHRLCRDIDLKDMLFVALTLELDGSLWTKDETLKKGLIKKGFNQFFEL